MERNSIIHKNASVWRKLLAVAVSFAMIAAMVPVMALPKAAFAADSSFTQEVNWTDGSAHKKAQLDVNLTIPSGSGKTVPADLDVVYIMDMGGDNNPAEIGLIRADVAKRAINSSFAAIQGKSSGARMAVVGFSLGTNTIIDFQDTALSSTQNLIGGTYSDYAAGINTALGLINGRANEEQSRPVRVFFVSMNSCNRNTDKVSGAIEAVYDTGAAISIIAKEECKSMAKSQEEFYQVDRYLLSGRWMYYNSAELALMQATSDLYTPYVRNVHIEVPLDAHYFDLANDSGNKPAYCTDAAGVLTCNAAKDKLTFDAERMSCGDTVDITAMFDFKKAAAYAPISNEATASYSGTSGLKATGVGFSFNMHSVTYNLAGGTGAPQPETVSALAGDTVSIAKVEGLSSNNGVFCGWNVADEYGAAIENDGESFKMPDSDVTITARYAHVYIKKGSALNPSANLTLNASYVKSAIESVRTDENCKKIVFQRSIDTSGTFTLNNASSDGSVKWWVDNSDPSNEILYFGADIDSGDTILLPSNCSKLFGGSSAQNKISYIEAIEGLDILDASNVTDMTYMFGYNVSLKELDLSSWNTPSLTKISNMFYNYTVTYYEPKIASQLEQIKFGPGWDTSKVTEMKSVFMDCKSLTSIDLTMFDVSKVTTFYCLFRACNELETIDISTWVPGSSTISFEQLFVSCSKLSNLNSGDFFKNAKANSCDQMFSGCSKLTSLDLDGIDTSACQKFSSMFSGCTTLETLTLSTLDTSSATTFSSMFSNCRVLKELECVKTFNTTSATNMSSMFSSCYALESLDLSSFDITNVTSFSSMLSSTCSNAPSKPVNVPVKDQATADKLTSSSGVSASYIKFVVPSSMSLSMASPSSKDEGTNEQNGSEQSAVHSNKGFQDELTQNKVSSSEKSSNASASDVKSATEVSSADTKDTQHNKSLSSIFSSIFGLFNFIQFAFAGDAFPAEFSAPTSSDPVEFNPRDIVTFTVEISFPGNAGSKSGEVLITDKIPEGMTYVNGSLSIGAGSGIFVDNKVDYDASTGTFTAIVKDMKSEEVGTPISFSYKAKAPAVRPAQTTYYSEPAEYSYLGTSGQSNLIPYYMKAASAPDPTFYEVTYANMSGMPAAADLALPASGKVLAGSTVTLPSTLEFEGWNFTGWKKGSDVVSDEQTINANTTFTAQWEQDKYSEVNFSFSGDAPAQAEIPAKIRAKQGERVLLPTPAAIEGWEFNGWKVSGTGSVVTEVEATGDPMNIVGTWSKKTYKITYETAYTGGGAAPTEKMGIAWGTKQSVEAPLSYFEESGKSYTFEGWETEDATVVNGSFEMPMKDVLFKAKWSIADLPVQHTLTLVNATTGGSSTTTTYYAGDTIEIKADAPASGKAFYNWDVSAGGVTEPLAAETKFVAPDDDAIVTALFGDHVHGNWTYTTSSVMFVDHLVAICHAMGDCDLPDCSISLSVDADDAVYTSTPYTGAVLNESELADWTDAGLSVPTIKYVGRGATSYGPSADAPTNAGEYYATISATGTDKTEATAQVAFEVTKTALTVTAKDSTVPFGGEAANNGVEYSGFLGDDDKSCLDGTLSYAYKDSSGNDYAPGSPTGTYSIVPSGLTGINYEVSFVNGTMTVIEAEIEPPTEDKTNYTYNGSAQTYAPVGFDATTMVMSSGTQTDAGTYPIVVSPKPGYKWAGGASDPSFTWIINKKTVEEPTASGKTFTYDGTEQAYEPEGFDTTTMSISGNTGTNAGTYAAKVSLKDAKNCEWAGGGSDPVEIPWTIAPLDISGATVTLGNALVYNGKEQAQDIDKVKTTGDKTLELSTSDYEVTGNKATEPGAYKMVLSGKGNFCGDVTATYAMAPTKDSPLKENSKGEIELGDGFMAVAAKNGEGAMETSFAQTKSEIIGILAAGGSISANELAQVAEGSRIDVMLESTDRNGSIDDASKEVIAKAADGREIGGYVDLSLYKQVDKGEKIQIKNAGGELTLTLSIPESLKGAQATDFAVVRNHEGTGKTLETKYNEAAQTLEFSSALFSDYAVAYKTVYTPEPTPVVDSNSTSTTSNSTKSGDESGMPLALALVALLAALASVAFFGLRRFYACATARRHNATSHDRKRRSVKRDVTIRSNASRNKRHNKKS